MLNDLMTEFRERIRNPFFSYFVLSWLAWNWKLVFYILFQDSLMSVTEKISYIKETFIDWGVNLFYPLLTATAVFAIYPIFSIATIWFWNYMRTKHKEYKAKATKEEIFTKRQYDELKRKLFKEKDYSERLEVKYADSLTAHEVKSREKKHTEEIESLEAKHTVEIKNIKVKYDDEKKRLEEENNELTQDKNNLITNLEELKKKNDDLVKSNKSLGIFKKSCVDLRILYEVSSLVGRKEYFELRSDIREFHEAYNKLKNDGTPPEILKKLEILIDKFQGNIKYKIFDEIYRIFEPIRRESEIHEKTKVVFQIMDKYKRI